MEVTFILKTYEVLKTRTKWIKKKQEMNLVNKHKTHVNKKRTFFEVLDGIFETN